MPYTVILLVSGVAMGFIYVDAYTSDMGMDLTNPCAVSLGKITDAEHHLEGSGKALVRDNILLSICQLATIDPHLLVRM